MSFSRIPYFSNAVKVIYIEMITIEANIRVYND